MSEPLAIYTWVGEDEHANMIEQQVAKLRREREASEQQVASVMTVENDLKYVIQGAHYGKNDWWDLPNQTYDSRSEALYHKRWPNDPDDTGWMWIPDLQLRVVRRVRRVVTVEQCVS
jgi:hypothetical protein